MSVKFILRKYSTCNKLESFVITNKQTLTQQHLIMVQVNKGHNEIDYHHYFLEKACPLQNARSMTCLKSSLPFIWAIGKVMTLPQAEIIGKQRECFGLRSIQL